MGLRRLRWELAQANRALAERTTFETALLSFLAGLLVRHEVLGNKREGSAHHSAQNERDSFGADDAVPG